MNLNKVALVYGTDTGNTKEIGKKIADALMDYGYETAVFNVCDVNINHFLNYDFLIFGIPTWDFGGIQKDWEEIGDELSEMDLSGKIVALYGLGDQRGYGDYFVDAMGWLKQILSTTDAKIIGYWPTEGYKFSASLAANTELTEFCGLAIDEDQQFDLTDKRIDQWVNKIISEYEEYLMEA